jgi:outer membrane protein TolC
MASTIQVSAGQLFEIADAAAAKGDQATAERAYEALIGDPSQEIRLEARFRLAMLEGKRGNLPKATRLLQVILDHRPDSARARVELAILSENMGIMAEPGAVKRARTA